MVSQDLNFVRKKTVKFTGDRKKLTQKKTFLERISPSSLKSALLKPKLNQTKTMKRDA